MVFVKDVFEKVDFKQEALGPRLTHLSEIATADMRMLCDIFPILSLQLMKGSLLKQFLVLKKKDVFLFFFILLTRVILFYNLAIFDLEVILLLQCVSTQMAQRFGCSQKLVFKMAAMVAILDFQSA